MNRQEFETHYRLFKDIEKIVVKCDIPSCPKKEHLTKNSARRNIKKNGIFKCRSCSFTKEGRAKISKNSSYKRTDETKQKMSEAKLKFFQTPEGKQFKRQLARWAAKGHSIHKFENAKRGGVYPSAKTGRLMPYASSYELRLCWLLDNDDSVLTYQTQLFYEVEDRGRCLDFLVTYKEGPFVAIEVKPKSRLTEEANIAQMVDSRAHAVAQGWAFRCYTEDELGLDCKSLLSWADAMRSTLTGIDFVAYRAEINRLKAKKHYDSKIAPDKVDVWCEFCQDTHHPLRLTYERNIARNGEYICERKGGQISGRRPKLLLRNPYEAEGKKKCSGRCQRILPLDDFSISNKKTGSRCSQCKECRANKGRENYQSKKGMASDADRSV